MILGLPNWIIWAFVILMFVTTAITILLTWYKSYNRFIIVIDDQVKQRIEIFKARLIIEDKIEKWQFFKNGWIKIQPPKTRKLLRIHQGKETRLMQRLAIDTYNDLDVKDKEQFLKEKTRVEYKDLALKEIDANILAQVPDEGIKDWQHQERKRNFERLMTRKDAIFFGAIIFFIIVIICVTIIFCVYPKYVSKMVDSMATQAKAYYDIAKCYQENPGMVNSSLSSISNKYIP